MRQTELDEVHPDAAGRSSERPVPFPDVLLYRGCAGDGEECLVTFDRRNVIVSRAIGGLPCRIRLSVSQYKAVAVVIRHGINIIRLVHDQAGLCLDLTTLGHLEEAEEYCDRLAAFLDLPALTLAGDKQWDEAMSGTLKRAAAARRKTNRAKRPRFLDRRDTGNVIEFPKIERREIIARN